MSVTDTTLSERNLLRRIYVLYFLVVVIEHASPVRAQARISEAHVTALANFVFTNVTPRHCFSFALVVMHTHLS